MREEDRGLLPRYVDGAGSLCSVALAAGGGRARQTARRRIDTAQVNSDSDVQEICVARGWCFGFWSRQTPARYPPLPTSTGRQSFESRLRRSDGHQRSVETRGAGSDAVPGADQMQVLLDLLCELDHPHVGEARSLIALGSVKESGCSGRESLLDEVMMHHLGARCARLCCRSQKFERCTA